MAAIHTARRFLTTPNRDIWHYDTNRSDIRTYEKGRYPTTARLYSFPQPIRAGYRSVGSPPRGLHYSGPGGAIAFTREIFLVSAPWIALAASIDILLVGGGGSGCWLLEPGLVSNTTPSGGGGGGVLVTNGLAVTLGFPYDMIVGPGGSGVAPQAGGDSFIREGFGAFTVLAIGGGGGRGPRQPASLQIPGRVTNGNGGGGSFDYVSGNPVYIPGAAGNGAGFAGGNGAGITAPPGLGQECAGGGGGGAGAVGTNGVVGAIGTQGTPGDGGDGIVPPPSTFDVWGVDIGEAGVFGGGGPGGSSDDGVNPWLVGNRGLGGGAANTGGGGGPQAFPNPNASDGMTGIVVIMYAT